ncbi:transcriptional regulator, MarR family [Pilibacter termitis]|uniref:Transcriptional regulator, MarR family n=1 Tax=Pilibacter termitis TaxID=263852 RepID=A0A1T4P6Z9_9ENTE|nr:MarR family transcriptional regulator [Pilibacter termitis]SJZ86688.1 transcriptional regulator, MarR family [Pilibacter termitis]
MDKEEIILNKTREVLNKMGWLNKYKMEQMLSDYQSSEVHTIECISKGEFVNVTKIAQSLYMTRSAASKIAKKLLDKKLIERYQRTENKKEVYFRLTEKGREVNEIHENLHKEFLARDKVVFDEITEEQLAGFLAFIQRYSKHLDEEIKREGREIT